MVRVPWQATDRQLRVFAAVLLLVCGGLGAAAWNGAALASASLWGLGALAGAAGLAWPRSIRWLYLLWLVAVYPIGWLVSHLLLGLFFFGLLAPVGLAMRLLRRDALLLRSKRRPAWHRRERQEGFEGYRRQA
jgi:hypothetical protein